MKRLTALGLGIVVVTFSGCGTLYRVSNGQLFGMKDRCSDQCLVQQSPCLSVPSASVPQHSPIIQEHAPTPPQTIPPTVQEAEPVPPPPPVHLDDTVQLDRPARKPILIPIAEKASQAKARAIDVAHRSANIKQTAGNLAADALEKSRDVYQGTGELLGFE